METNSKWLGKILFNEKYRLTSKDKLVASYLLFLPKDGIYLRSPRNYPSLAHAISAYSGLAVRTVQKSLGRLVGIGAVAFVTDVHLILEEVEWENI